MMEEIRQLKADKTKEKGSQHDPDHAADREETLAGGVPRNAEQRFITMTEVAALLELERARTPNERFYARRPPYPLKVLSKPYPERYESRAFAQYDGRKGSAIEHASKFIDTLGPYAADEDLCLQEFSKSLCDRAYTWYIGLKPYKTLITKPPLHGLSLSKSSIKNCAILFRSGWLVEPDQRKLGSTRPNNMFRTPLLMVLHILFNWISLEFQFLGFDFIFFFLFFL